jgi:hypothetical protein
MSAAKKSLFVKRELMRKRKDRGEEIAGIAVIARNRRNREQT